MGIKNFWALNVDELLVADKLKSVLKKTEYEVFFPLNSQMKGIDLMLINLKNNKSRSIQIKGSRTWDSNKAERARYGEGGAAWFRIDKASIFKPQNKVDFYVFVLHNFVDGDYRREIKVDYLIIPEANFRNICQKKKVGKGNYYHFFIWIDHKDKRAFDFRHKQIMLSKYLNNWDLLNKY